MDRLANSAWLPQTKPLPDKLNLFGFPFAGGGSDCYRDWTAAFDNRIQFCPVEYPGRARRWGEPLLATMDDLAEAALAALRPWLDTPFAFFGHSMGGQLAYELARRLGLGNEATPVAVFVSSWPAAHVPVKQPIKHLLDDPAFVDCLRNLEGTPEDVLDCPELLELMLPIIRNDFRLVESWVHPGGPPLACPIHAMGGDRDPEVPQDELEAWHQHSGAGATVEIFDGGHFYLFQHRQTVCRRMSGLLSPALAPPAAAPRHPAESPRATRPKADERIE